jgi:membrane-associated protease RseP (regulator of RpoE activity)
MHTENTRQQGSAVGAWLGVTFDPEVRNFALVRSVAADSPAERAGLVAGDVIELLNGRQVSSYEDVLSAIRWMRPGDSLDIEVTRRIRTQVVLDRSANRQVAGESIGNASNMREDLPSPSLSPEQLPAPVTYQQPASRSVSPYNNDRFDLRRYNDSPVNRRTGADRNRRSVDRDDSARNRGLLRRRRS